MKKTFKLILLSVLLLMFTTGCEDASAKISDSNSMLMKIGNTTFTKGQLYENMTADDAGNTVISEAMKLVADAEIETTDEITAEANDIYEDYKAQITETTDEPFEEAIKLYGYDSVEDFMNYCITNAKSNHLFDKYIEENWDSLTEEYYPLKAKMIFVDTSDKGPTDAYALAEKAIEEINSGKSFDEVAEEYSDNSSLTAEKLYTRNDSTLDYNVLQYLTTVTSTGLSQVITNKDVDGYYVILVTNVNHNQLKEDLVAQLKNDTDFGDRVTSSFFKAHNFTIYDITTYDNVKANYPAYLVQE